MNFHIFSAQYLPTVGGVERYTNSLAKELIKKGHNVAVVTSSLAGMPWRETDCDGINIRRLPSVPFMNGRFPTVKPSKELNEFIKDFARDKPDFCVIQTRFYTLSLFAAWLCKKYNVPAIVIEHGTAHLMRGGFTGFAGSVYEHIACKYIYSKCPNFYGVSESCCKWLGHFGVKTDNTLYNSVSPDVLNANAEKGIISLIGKLPTDIDNKTIIAFSARFIAEKGVMQLLSAFEKINCLYDNVVLIMAGDGPLWNEAKNRNCKNVIFTSRLPYEENLALIKLADIFCLPTFSEGFATTVLEAAALKTYIVTTPTGGTPRLILDETYGTLMPDMSEDSIFNALCRVLDNIDALPTAKGKTYENLIKNFTWDKTGDTLLEIANQKVHREEK